MASGHEVSDNGCTWRIRLRDSLTFHDATPVRAVDCIASIQRWCARKPFGQLLVQAVDTWAARDDRTIEIRLTRPFPLLLDAMALPDASAWIMPEHLAHTDPNTALKEMVGSGPYRFIADEYNSDNRVVYEKFDAYVPRSDPPDWASGGKIAHFGRVERHVIPDSATTAAAALMTGEVDWLEVPEVDLMPMLVANSDIVSKIANPYGKLGFIPLNCLQPPFDDVRLRRAVMRGVVQEDYMRAGFGDDASTWTECKSLWPRKTPYHSDDDASLVPGSLDAGRTALKDAGYAGQKVVILDPADRPYYSALTQVSADSLHRMGMNVDLQQTDWGSLVKRRASQEPVEKGGWSMFIGALPATLYANPGSSFLVRGQGAAGWFGWWANARRGTGERLGLRARSGVATTVRKGAGTPRDDAGPDDPARPTLRAHSLPQIDHRHPAWCEAVSLESTSTVIIGTTVHYHNIQQMRRGKARNGPERSLSRACALPRLFCVVAQSSGTRSRVLSCSASR
jgi:peptide/nickel transport system substrate-binding protein